jgi:hypothetical protein
MAATSSTFTMADRRKRIATYGKSTRPPPTLKWNTDAPSPEPPRKQAGLSGGLLKKPSTSLKAIDALQGSRASLAKSPAQDVFNVPSDDELRPASRVAALAPAKKRKEKQPASVDEWDVPSSSDETITRMRPVAKTPQPPRKTAANRKPLAVPKSQRKVQQVNTISSDDPLAADEQGAGVSQRVRNTTKEIDSQVQETKKKIGKVTNVSQAPSPVPATTALRGTKSKLVSTLKKPAAQPQMERDIFDVPSEDDLTVSTSPRRAKSVLKVRKTPPGPPANNMRASPEPMESDDSNTSRKRKRGLPRKPMASKKLDAAETISERHVPQRKSKHQRTGDRQLESTDVPEPRDDISLSKPKRTRVRTVAGSVLPPIAKGQSSPASLHSMLTDRSLPKPSSALPTDINPEPTGLLDETLYDIADAATPLSYAKNIEGSGSITPRQKQIFNNLLKSTPDMPSITKLQLTNRKPAVSPLALLARSSSDIPQSDHSYKKKLVELLRKGGSNEDDSEEDSDEDSEDEDESEEDVNHDLGTDVNASAEEDDKMDVDPEPQAESQNSQNAYHVASGSKVTYAKQRSYLEESNLEDGLLLSMDLGDAFGLSGSGRKKDDLASDGEDDPTSQVRGMHELKRLGQNQKFQLEAQTAIDDIEDKAGLGPSARRSAMLDFCTRTADRRYLDQLFDSALGHQLFKSISSNGEVIFDFAAIVTVAFILDNSPSPFVLEEIYKSDILASITKLLDFDSDIGQIAKDRKANLSKVGRESVADLRTLVQQSSIWSHDKPEKVSPQIVAMRTLDLMVLALRKAGRQGALLDHNVICKLLDIAAGPFGRFRTPQATSQDMLTLNLTFSILEPASMSTERQATWSNDALRRLAGTVPVFFGTDGPSPIKLALRLCMNLTNNRPKACAMFAEPSFIRPLIEAISHGFAQVTNHMEEAERIEVVEDLVFSLGLMMNLTEFSDKARSSILKGGDELVDALATIFIEGSKRAAQVRTNDNGSQCSDVLTQLGRFLGRGAC